jgi:hypothetical protein
MHESRVLRLGGCRSPKSILLTVPQVVPQNSRSVPQTRANGVFGVKEKPADLAGFSVKSLVALPGIEPGF